MSGMTVGFIRWNIDPEIANILGFSWRYYGTLFVTGILLCIAVLKWIFKRENIALENLDTLTIYGVFGIFAGARLGHCLFYEPAYYFTHPLEMLLPIQVTADGRIQFTGYLGLASHGGALGLILSLVFYSRKTGQSLLATIDLLAVVAALGATFIRLANLMNSEIIGMPTTMPWAFIFERVDSVPRHPAQLYEAILYLLIFGIMLLLYTTRREKLKKGFFFGLVLVLIFTARFFVEFVKEDQVAFEDGMILNMGQLLSLPYIFTGIGFLAYSLLQNNRQPKEIG
ncbi:MAG: prolipoprotein diacylglyceryl transferase [Cyclobacteriaceae bacterium]|nr:prolipoprotein diacylglyceryl transferase [Cyclobacteriaceae bacterium]